MLTHIPSRTSRFLWLRSSETAPIRRSALRRTFWLAQRKRCLAIYLDGSCRQAMLVTLTSDKVCKAGFLIMKVTRPAFPFALFAVAGFSVYAGCTSDKPVENIICTRPQEVQKSVITAAEEPFCPIEQQTRYVLEKQAQKERREELEKQIQRNSDILTGKIAR